MVEAVGDLAPGANVGIGMVGFVVDHVWVEVADTPGKARPVGLTRIRFEHSAGSTVLHLPYEGAMLLAREILANSRVLHSRVLHVPTNGKSPGA